jgi:outer membrane protein TolC
VAPGKYFGYPNVKLVGIPFATKYSANYGVTLKQVLFDGQVFVGLKARQTALDYYKANQELTEQQLRQNITKVYYQLLLSKVQVELIDANIARAQELLHNSSEMFKNGFAERLDVDKATVQLTNLQSNRVQVLYNIDDGYLGLKVLMGMPVRDSLVLTDSLTYEMVRQGSLSDAYKYSDRRDFQALEFNRKLNEFDIQRYKRQYLPTASLTANYAQTGYGLDFSDITGGKFWFPSSYVGLNISVPIFDGFYKDANVRQARLKLQQTNNNLEAMQISIDNDVKNAQLKFGAALADLDFQKKNMDLARGVYEQTRKKFDQGLGSNTEITSAQTDMIQAQNNYFNALYNAISAKVDYQFAIGKL